MDNRQLIYGPLTRIVLDDNAINESVQKNNGKLVFPTLLQIKDAKNQNGRRYPGKILEREVNKYMSLIRGRSAVGETDHPCVDPASEVLAINGWQNIQEIQVGDRVCTLNINTDQPEYVEVQAVINDMYTGIMYYIHNKQGGYEILVTPNHKLLVWDTSDHPQYITAEDFYQFVTTGSNPQFANYTFKRAGTWRGKDMLVEVQDYTGNIWCITTSNHNFLIRYNGCICWTGNSDRNIVNLKDSSHLITDAWWKGDELHGMVEILNELPNGKILEGLIRSHVPVGLSSRGLGSVKKIQEEGGGWCEEVQEDFELVCWDAVSNPSVRGAWLMTEALNSNPQYQTITEIDKLISKIINWE